MIAPLRDKIWTRDEEIAYAPSAGIPVEAKAESPYSIDDNLFGRAIEAGHPRGPVGRAARGRVRAHRRARDDAPAPVEVVVGFERRPPGLARRRGAAARRADRGAERARRRVRDRADRHDREPRRRHQEPRAVRGAGGDRADRGAPRARGPRPDEGRGDRRSASSSERWAKLVYDGLWFSPLREAIDAFVDATQELVDGRGARCELRPGAAVVTGRRSEHALYAEHARVVRRRRDVPARGGGGLHPASPRSRSSSPPRASAGCDARVTLWAGRVGDARSPEVVGVPARGRRRAAPVRLRGDARSTRGACTRPGCSTTTSCARSRRRSTRSRGAARRAGATRTSTPRSSGSSARSGGRSTPAARATTRSRRRSGSTSPTRARRRARRSTRFARVDPRPRRGGGGDADARATRTSSARSRSRVGHHLLAWVEMLERDLRALRFAAGAGRTPSPLGAGALAGLDAAAAAAGRRADAELARRRRRPRLRARLPLRVRRAASSHLSRIGEELVLWATERVRLRPPARGRRRPARR